MEPWSRHFGLWTFRVQLPMSESQTCTIDFGCLGLNFKPRISKIICQSHLHVSRNLIICRRVKEDVHGLQRGVLHHSSWKKIVLNFLSSVKSKLLRFGFSGWKRSCLTKLSLYFLYCPASRLSVAVKTSCWSRSRRPVDCRLCPSVKARNPGWPSWHDSGFRIQEKANQYLPSWSVLGRHLRCRHRDRCTEPNRFPLSTL